MVFWMEFGSHCLRRNPKLKNSYLYFGGPQVPALGPKRPDLQTHIWRIVESDLGAVPSQTRIRRAYSGLKSRFVALLGMTHAETLFS